MLALCFCVIPLTAQEAETDEAEYRSSFELFVGGVTETEESASGFGVGVEYNYRLSSRWSIGVEAIEISTTDVSRDWLVVFPVYFHITESFGVKAGPGLEGSLEKSEDGSESKTQFALRLGAGYEFELGERFTITPEINADLIGGNVTWVYGLSFGLRF
jgi:opacity protein-like surface antigen